MDKKESNKLYYQMNKVQIAEKLYKKEQCELCNRTVSHQNMTKHLKTTYCHKRCEENLNKELLHRVKNNIDYKDLIK